ncbi:MAG: NfeD family protein [Halobacteriota archaeon]
MGLAAVGVAWMGIAQVSALDAAFYVFVIGLLLMMTGAFGEPNMALVGIAVSLVGVVGMLLGPYSTPIVLGALIPIVGFVLFYLYRFVEFPRTEAPKQTTAVEHLRGRVGRVTETVTPRGGTIHLRGGGFDPNFRCRTREGTIPPGERAIVVDPGGGNVLVVAPEGSVDPEELRATSAEETGWVAVHRLRAAVDRRLRG